MLFRSGTTGHAESVQVVFDSTKISYGQLLEVFWHNVDPLTPNAQFCDHGRQYRTAIFYHNEEQKKLAKQKIEELEKTHKYSHPIVTQVVPAKTFWKAEEYHQQYLHKRNLNVCH